jgi:acetyl esterase/lipase
MKRILLALLIAIAVPPIGSAEEPAATRIQDVIYGRKYGTALTFDVFTPKKANGAAVIWVVSGGWFSSHDAINPAFVSELLKRGYTVFAVVHGSQPKFTIPEILQDLNRAVRFIRYHARDYHIDPRRIGITGASAGGHLSLMQGTTGDEGDPKAKDPIDRTSSRVQAVACFFPPTDFLNYGEKGKDAIGRGVLAGFRAAFDVHELDPQSKALERLTDEAKILELGRRISPITHVTGSAAPTLIIHGDADKLVPIQQAETMVARLKEAGVPAELVVKKGAAHGWPGLLGDIVTIADWFDKYLGADGPAARSDGRHETPAQQEKTFEKEIAVKAKVNYLLFLPEGYAKSDKAWPLLVFLHGSGESGNDLAKVKTHGPPKIVETRKDFPFIVVSPQSPGFGWNVDALHALVDEIVAKYRVDPDRVYLTGLSMGGFGTWALAAAYPEQFAAIVPICGGGRPADGKRLRGVPAWVFHGAKDRTVPLERSEAMVKALKEAGGEVKFTVYADAGHDSWTQAYNDPELYRWLLAHRRHVTTWAGTWKGTEPNHGGDLKCLARRLDPSHWQATFSGHCGRDFAFEIDMKGQQEGDRIKFEGQVDLGEKNGGVYHWTGEIAGDTFDGRYATEKGQKGQFQMKQSPPRQQGNQSRTRDGGAKKAG